MNQDRIALTVPADQPGPRISRHIFGQFAEAATWLAADSSVTVTLAHTDPVKPVTVELTFTGLSTVNRATGKILTAPALTDINTPDTPNRVASKPWTDFSFDGKKLIATLPPGCVAAVSLAK